MLILFRVARPAPLSALQNPMEAARDAHAICVLTEWDEFKVRRRATVEC